jgi:hypothetical protein
MHNAHFKGPQNHQNQSHDGSTGGLGSSIGYLYNGLLNGVAKLLRFYVGSARAFLAFAYIVFNLLSFIE